MTYDPLTSFPLLPLCSLCSTYSVPPTLSFKHTGYIPPQGLCTCCSLCMECSPSRYSPSHLFKSVPNITFLRRPFLTTLFEIASPPPSASPLPVPFHVSFFYIALMTTRHNIRSWPNDPSLAGKISVYCRKPPVGTAQAQTEAFFLPFKRRSLPSIFVPMGQL